MKVKMSDLSGVKRELRPSREQISIVIPALNEEAGIGKTIKSIPRLEIEDMGYQVQVLVVDNGSVDRTRELARQAGAQVVSEAERGKGRAFRTGLRFVEGKFVFMLDGDGTYSAEYIPEMLRLLKYNEVIIGSRLLGRPQNGAMSRFNLIGNRLLSIMASILFRKKVSDVCTGLWGFRAEIVKALNLKSTGFELEVELFSSLARRGCSIAELPIHYSPRATPPKLRAINDGMRIGRTLLIRALWPYDTLWESRGTEPQTLRRSDFS